MAVLTEPNYFRVKEVGEGEEEEEVTEVEERGEEGSIGFPNNFARLETWSCVILQISCKML